MAETGIKKLSWDSDFFQMEIGEVNLPQDFGNVVPDGSYDLLYAKSGQPIQSAIPGYKSGFSETKVVFSKKLSGQAAVSPKIHSAETVPFEIGQVYELAYESGKYSRFKLDTHFSENHFKDLYKAWVDNSLNRKFADAVLLYIDEGRPSGFVTYKEHGAYALIGLIAVSPQAQGKGIGSQLLAAVESRLVNDGVNELRIPTQRENEAACSFYTKSGYQRWEITYITHFYNLKKSSNQTQPL